MAVSSVSEKGKKILGGIPTRIFTGYVEDGIKTVPRPLYHIKQNAGWGAIWVGKVVRDKGLCSLSDQTSSPVHLHFIKKKKTLGDPVTDFP